MASSSVRYAPEDPTLPKPWKGLIDGSTGYLYFWNPETNVTQYERPAPLPENLPPPPPNPPKTALIATGSFQGKQSSASSGHAQQRDLKEDDGRYSGSRSHQQQSTKSNVHSQSYANGSVNVGHGTSNAYSHGHGAHTSKSSARGHGSSDGGAGLSVESYRRQHEITVTGDDVPPPLMTFESTNFPSEILKEVHHAGFSFPTPIQAQSWPVVLQSRDIVAIAKTGSGKTLGYLIPGFVHLKRLRNNSRMGPTVLVLAPTRELATQIQEEAVKFGRSSKVSCTCLYGGAPKGPQLRDLDRGADVVVATPGRLNDILEMRRISLRQVSYLVLDEADRMLDMGFEPQIRKIVKEIPPRRQTLMFTATWPKEVRKIAADLLVHPIQVNIGSIDELVANSAITQHIEVMTPMEKQRRLEQILRSQEPGSKVIVFCSTKRMCDQLARTLTRSFSAAAIHGDKSQSERDYVLSQFRTGRSPILVATDVAARGLDIKDIRVVINYDFPTGVEDYVHRIGRTGRAGATGVSYTFFCDQDAKYASDLIKVLEGANQRVPSELRDLVRRGGYGKARSRWGSSSGGRDGGRSLGGGRSDSSYGGTGGWGSSGGRLESARVGRHSDREPARDRYEHGCYGSSHEDDDERARYDTKGIANNDNRRTGDRASGHSRSRSRSPVGAHGGLNDNRSPNRGPGEKGSSRSRSGSRSRNHAHTEKSRSRSRSRSLNRHGGCEPGRGWSPAAKQNSPPNQRTGPDHSPPSRYQQQPQQQPQRSPYSGDGMQPQRSPSPYNGNGTQPQRSPSPYDGHGTQRWRSPAQHDGDDMREADSSDHPRIPRDKSRSPAPHKSMDDETPASGTPPQQWTSSHYGGDVDAKDPSDAPVRSSAPPPYEGGEEEEEGIIPAEDEDGMIPNETGRDSPRD